MLTILCTVGWVLFVFTAIYAIWKYFRLSDKLFWLQSDQDLRQCMCKQYTKLYVTRAQEALELKAKYDVLLNERAVTISVSKDLLSTSNYLKLYDKTCFGDQIWKRQVEDLLMVEIFEFIKKNTKFYEETSYRQYFTAKCVLRNDMIAAEMPCPDNAHIKRSGLYTLGVI